MDWEFSPKYTFVRDLGPEEASFWVPLPRVVWKRVAFAIVVVLVWQFRVNRGDGTFHRNRPIQILPHNRVQ